MLASSPVVLLGDANGNIYQYSVNSSDEDGEIIDSYFDTKDFNFTTLNQRQKVTRIDVSYVGDGLEVWYSTNKGKSWDKAADLGESTDFARKQINIRTSGDWIRFRFRNRTLGGNFQWNRANIHWQAGGRI